MHTRYLLIGAVATSLATLAAAEPAKPDVSEPARPAEQPAKRPAEVLLASAEQVPTQVPSEAPTVQEQAPAPAKKRAARVTTCRCAGQNQR